MRKLVYSAVLEMLDKRREDIEGNIRSSEEMRNESRELKQQYEDMMKDAYEEGDRIRKEITESAHKEKERIILEAKAESVRLREKMESEIALEVSKAKSDLRSDIAGLAVQLSEKILEKEVDAKAHDKMIKTFLEEMGDSVEE